MNLSLKTKRKTEICNSLKSFYKSEFDETLSDFRAEQLLDFMLSQIGPSQYNQAIQDARKFMSEKLEDLDTEFYVPEEL